MQRWMMCLGLALMLVFGLSAVGQANEDAMLPWADPDFDPEAADPIDDSEQELFFDNETDGGLVYSGPIPPEAKRRTLYIIDEQKEMLPCEDWSEAAVYADEGMEIPRLYQYDFPKVLCFYRQYPKSVASSGCGATSMSMVIAYLTGNMTQDPYTLLRWAVNNGMYEGSGLTHEALTEMAVRYGVGGQWMKGTEALVISALRQGYPVIAHMGPGQFTKRGHYIVLRGLTADDRILVNDPNSWQNSDMAYEYAEIAKQTRSVAPFMICYRSDE